MLPMLQRHQCLVEIGLDKSRPNVCDAMIDTCRPPGQGWKPKPKPENPVLKGILETQTETDTYSAKFLKT